MTIPEISLLPLPPPPLAPAELCSADGSSVFRLLFRGYENAQDNWIDVDLEYQCRRAEFRVRLWEFDAQALARAARASQSPGVLYGTKKILWAPYRNEGLSMAFQPGRIRARWQQFPRERQGLFAKGLFSGWGFSFKVNRAGCHRFAKGLRRAAEIFPVRHSGDPFPGEPNVTH